MSERRRYRYATTSLSDGGMDRPFPNPYHPGNGDEDDTPWELVSTMHIMGYIVWTWRLEVSP